MKRPAFGLLLLMISSGVLLSPFGGPACAAEPFQPTIEARFRSIDQLLPQVAYLTEILNQGEAAKQGLAFFQDLFDDTTGLDGIDVKRPFGFAATIQEDVVSSEIYLMIPLADQPTMLAALRDKLEVELKKLKDDLYEIEVPNLPFPVYIRFTQGYAIATLKESDYLTDRRIVDTKRYFAAQAEESASFKFHMDRVPEELKKTILTQAELQLQDELFKPVPDESAAQKKLRAWIAARFTEVVPMIANEGKELSLTVTIDPKRDEVTFALQLIPKPNTLLAKIVAGWEGRSGQPVLTTADSSQTIFQFATRAMLPSEAKASFEPVLAELLQTIIDDAKPTERGFVQVGLDAIRPTLEAGVLDFSLLMLQNKNNSAMSLALSLEIAKGKEIEKLVKLLGPFLPPDQVKLTLDQEKFGELTLHQAGFPVTPTLERLFNTGNVWLGISDSRLVLCIEPEGKLIRDLIVAKPNQNAPPLATFGRVNQLARLLDENITESVYRAVCEQVFVNEQSSREKERFQFDLRGGKSIDFKFSAKGTTLKFLAVSGSESKK